MSGNEDSGSLADAIESVVERVLNNSVSTSFPAIITKVSRASVNPNTVIVDVAPNLMNLDGATGLPIPEEILNIPLMMVGRTNNFIIRPPTDADSLIGAGVNCIVSSRYLANWKNTGGIVVASDARRFDKADAVAILGLFPDIQSWPTPPKINTAQIKVLDATFMEIGNSTTDLFRVVSDLTSIMNQIVTQAGPVSAIPSLISGKLLAALATELATITNSDPTP